MDEKPVPIGVVTGPLSATLFRRIESSTSCGSGSPKREIASEPTKYFSHSMSTPAHSRMDTTLAVTSGPMPSPGSSVSLCFAMEHPFRPLPRRRGVERHRQQRRECAVVRQLVKTTLHALERGGYEFEVVHPSACNRLLRECSEDLDRALQQRLEIAAPDRAPLAVRQRALAG